MLESKSLVTSLKNELLDQLLGSIDQEFIREAIMPPPELISYLRGKKIEEEKIEEEKIKFHQIVDEWMVRMNRVLGRGVKINATLLRELLNAIPEPTRTKVRNKLIELYNARKSEE